MNPHPVLSAFPIALIASVVILELISAFTRFDLRQSARVNLNLAAIFVLLAFLSGYIGSEFAEQTFKMPAGAIEKHHFFGKLLLFAIYPCVVLRYAADMASHNRAAFKGGYFALLIIALILVANTGWLGGELVFKFGAGVSAAK